MRIIRSPKRMSDFCSGLHKRRVTLGLVPTMGALHQGHLSLIRAARRENKTVLVSIFVNPTQFSPKEDFKSYPRPIKKDLLLCRRNEVDIVFLPPAEEIYPRGFSTYVEVEKLGRLLCGKSRPEHFRGVSSVVAKLFNIVRPDNAYFGQKDAQQAIIIKRMVEDLNFPVKVKIMPTLREKDGLAISSRNKYLSKNEKKDAVALSLALKLAKAFIGRGIKDAGKIISSMRQVIISRKSAKIDYISIVDADNLRPLNKVSGNCLIALAVFIGKTRLIDNIIIKKGSGAFLKQKKAPDPIVLC